MDGGVLAFTMAVACLAALVWWAQRPGRVLAPGRAEASELAV